MKRALLLAALLAPAPQPKPPPAPPALAPGRYALDWGGSEWACTLRPGGRWECGSGSASRPFVGSWHWEPATRTLRVQETQDGWETECRWECVLGARALEGEAAFESGKTVRVGFRREGKTR